MPRPGTLSYHVTSPWHLKLTGRFPDSESRAAGAGRGPGRCQIPGRLAGDGDGGDNGPSLSAGCCELGSAKIMMASGDSARARPAARKSGPATRELCGGPTTKY